MVVTMKNGVFWDEPHGITSQKTPFFGDQEGQETIHGGT
jgi:hypothetical protein